MYRSAVACGLIALLAAPLAAADKPTPDPTLSAIEDAVTGLVERARPSVVCILVSRSDAYKQFDAAPSDDEPGRLGAFDAEGLRKKAQERNDRTREQLVNRLDLARPEHVPESFGSGVIIDTTGLVLTPYHVVRDATKVYVRVPGGKGYYADVHAADSRSDLAVLRLIAPPRDLKALPLDSHAEVRQGQFVLAVTNTYAAGFRKDRPDVEWGLVSNLLTRQEQSRERQAEVARPKRLYELPTLIQTTAKLNAACSGGALLNMKGELIGITSSLAVVSNEDAPGGFAVPMSPAMRRIIQCLKEGKEVEYGFLGVTFNNPGGGVEGVKISGITTGSPADQAHVPTNQYIVKVDGMPVRDFDDVSLAIGAALAGRTIVLEVAPTPNARGHEYKVELAKYYFPGPFIASRRPSAVGGLRVDYASTLIKTSVGGQMPIPTGVVVREVVHGSPADKAGIQIDTVITRVNGRQVFTPSQYYDEVARGSGPLELTVKGVGGADKTEKLERK
jgi:S1-C subfamily serine protease